MELGKDYFEGPVYLNILTMINRLEEMAQSLIIPALKIRVLQRPYTARGVGGMFVGYTPSEQLKEAIAWGYTQTKRQYGWFELVGNLTGITPAQLAAFFAPIVGEPLVLDSGIIRDPYYKGLTALRLKSKTEEFGADGAAPVNGYGKDTIAKAINAAIAPIASDEETFATAAANLRYELNRVRIPPDATLENFVQVELRKPITNMVGAFMRLDAYQNQVLPKLAKMREIVKQEMARNSAIAAAAQAEINALAVVKMGATQADLVAQQQAASAMNPAPAPAPVSASAADRVAEDPAGKLIATSPPDMALSAPVTRASAPVVVDQTGKLIAMPPPAAQDTTSTAAPSKAAGWLIPAIGILSLLS